jgi:hypothetical protein
MVRLDSVFTQNNPNERGITTHLVAFSCDLKTIYPSDNELDSKEKVCIGAVDAVDTEEYEFKNGRSA